MPLGYVSKVLVVDLGERKYLVEEPDRLFYRTYMGGKGVALHYLLKYVHSKVDPLGPENVLVFSTGVLTGAPAPGASRFSVAARSPLTGAYGEAEAGGWFGPALKMAGFDAVVIKGRSEVPVYLWIHDGVLEFKDARHIWGQETGEAYWAIQDEIGLDGRARAAVIGPAGENLVRYACIVSDLRYVCGRCGLGAVMGSKNLKAVVAYGKGPVDVADKDSLRDVAGYVSANYQTSPLSRSLFESGTAGGLLSLNAAGILPTRNFRSGAFEGAQRIGWDSIKSVYVGRKGCYACPIRCKKEIRCGGKYETDPRFGSPEYETLAAFGSNCGVDDLAAVAKAGELCNRLGLDTISCGSSIAFLMECVELGLIRVRLESGEPRFGNAEAMVELVQKISRREGIGRLLGEGVARAAGEIGSGAHRLAMHVKGQELPMHEPRGKFSVGLAYAVSETGADHMRAPHDTMFEKEGAPSLVLASPLGILEPMDPLDSGPKKIRAYMYMENLYSAWNCLGLCAFVPAPRGLIPLDKVVALLRSVTGWETSVWEISKAGERAINMARVLNVRLGFGGRDDSLPERLFSPLEGGRLKGLAMEKRGFEEGRAALYAMRGWTEDGEPTRGKLMELGLEWVGQSAGQTCCRGEDECWNSGALPCRPGYFSVPVQWQKRGKS